MNRSTVRGVVGVAVVLSLTMLYPIIRPADAGAPKVVILDTTVDGGEASTEAVAAINLGFDVDIVDAATWGAMTESDFAAYEGIILGDPDCSGMSNFQPAIDNADVWSSAVDGNKILIGTDPVVHLDGGASGTGGQVLTEQGVGFALDGVGDTGLYLTLSCSAGDDLANELLSGFGTFDTVGTSCDDDIHIVATHPALAGLADEDLADWGCSTHEGFTVWPEEDFLVLALALVAVDPVFTAEDGTQGNPYILASGEGLEPIRAVDLAPDAQTRDVGQACALTVSVVIDDAPVDGADVDVAVISGPNTGETGTVTTDAAGEATFSYVGTKAGTDTIRATYDNDGNPLESDDVTCTFVAAGTAPPTAPRAEPIQGTPRFTG